MKITTFNNLDEITGNEGKILLYDEAKSKIGASTETVNEIIHDQVGGDISRLEGRVDTVESNLSTATTELNNTIVSLSGTVSADYATKDDLGKVGNFIVTNGEPETFEPVLDPTSAETKSIYLVQNDDVTGKDQYYEWIVTENDDTKEWTCIGETTIDLKDYALSADVEAELALKEDKVFVAEYNVTPYADIKAAYDAGKQIVCKYTPVEEDQSETVLYCTSIIFVSVPGIFVFNTLTDQQTSYQIYIGNNIPWNFLQTQLQTNLTAGTDLVINDGVIGVNTNGTATGEYAFAEGNNTLAKGEASHAEGLNTIAADIADHVEGIGSYVEQGGCNHVEGFQYHSYNGIGPASDYYGTNKVKFYNTSTFTITGNTINGSLYELVKAFKDKFIVSCEYSSPTEYHYVTNAFFKPKLYKIIDVNLVEGTNQFEITIDGTFDCQSRGTIVLWGPTTISSINGGGGGLTPGQSVNIFTTNGLGFPGNNLENVRTDNCFLSFTVYYTPAGASESTLFYKIIRPTSITYDSSTNVYTFELDESIEIPSDAAGGGYSFAVQVLNSYYYGCNHIEGRDNVIKNGECSHVEGSNNYINGSWSHAEGYNTSAKGQCTHAEGYYTVASDGEANYTDAEHAEGYQTSAFGRGSHAEGTYTIASANGGQCHTEGYMTTALADHAHAEGQQTKAAGSNAHAEGFYTTAVGTESHAEGYSASAVGNVSHAEGYCTSAKGQCSHTEGSGTSAIGKNSHAEGVFNSAYGDVSHAEGGYTLADNYYSHAEGLQTSAVGKASHSEGGYTSAVEDYSHAEGSGTSAVGKNSHAEGELTIASGNGSHAEGQYTSAEGIYTHTEGQNTYASGWDAHAEGYRTSAIGNGSHSEGYSAIASGTYSHVEGSGTSAIGQCSHAEGRNTSAVGSASHTEGQNTRAIGNLSHAEGNNTIASGNDSHAEGNNTIA